MKRVKLIVVLLVMLSSVFANAQIQKERRVYYLDCSYSMVKPNAIWDQVRENLKNAIDKVSDQTTELLVIPFAFDNVHHNALQCRQELATATGKQNLKDYIDALPMSKNTMTYHSDPLKDFYANRVAPDRINYMFFMTDGQNEEKPDMFLPLLKDWGARYGDKNVYGFYVMLANMAKNQVVADVISKQPHLWKVETADVNINLVRLHPTAIFNARTEKYFDIPVYGNTDGKQFDIVFPNDAPYHVTSAKMQNGKLRVTITYNMDMYSLPYSAQYMLPIQMKGGGEYDFLVTDSVQVKCLSKPERVLKISIR